MENVPIMLLVGSAGIIITIILCITGVRKKTKDDFDSSLDYITIFKIGISVFSLIYLFRLIMMFFTGMISNFTIPSVIGGLLGLLPILVITFVNYRGNRLKV